MPDIVGFTSAPSISSVTDNVGAIKGTVSDNGKTDDTNLVVRVSLSGTNAAENDIVQLYNGNNALGNTTTLTANDISRGYVDITTPNLSDGTTYTLNVKLTDSNGNESTASTNHSVTVDTTAPDAPSTISLNSDSGESNSDGITNSGVVNVTLSATLNAGEIWEYSVDSGATWITGTGGTASTSVQFTLIEGSYSSGQVRVRTSDDVGLKSNAIQLGALKIDSTNPSSATLSSASISINNAQANTGVDIFDGINSPHTTDISSINITIAGSNLDTANDKVVLDSEQSIGSDFSTSSAVTVGGVSVTYSYVQSTGKLTIKKSDGSDFSRAELTNVTEAVKFKTTSTTDGDRTFAINYEDKAGNTSSTSTVTITGTNLGVTSLSTTVNITGISDDTGVSGDYITKDNDGLTISGTISQALGADEILEYYNGTSWSDISSSLSGSPATSFSYADASLTSDTTIKVRVRNTSTNAESTVVEQTIDIDTSAPSVDLSSDSGVQNSETTTVTQSEATTGKVIFENIQNTTASDINTVKVVISGANLDETNDQIVVDTAQNINSDFSATNVTVGGVSGVDYSYVASTKTLNITKNGGGVFSAEQINNIQSAIKYKSTSTTEGNREFSISYIDVAANTGASATQTVQLDTSVPTIASATVASVDVVGYKAIEMSNNYGGNPNVLNRGETVDISSYIPDGMTATEFLNSLVGFKANWGGAGIDSGANNIGTNTTYTSLSQTTSNQSIQVQWATNPYIKQIDLRFIVNSDSSISIRNNGTAYDSNEVPYQDLPVTGRTIDYGLANIKLFYKETLTVNDNSPDIDVTYDGTHAKVGDIIQILEGSTVLATYTLTASDIGAGNKTVRVSSTVSLSKGVHNLDVKYTDTAGNTNTLSSGVQFTATDAPGQDINMKITGLRSTEPGEIQTDQLLDSNNYLTSSQKYIKILGVQDTASFITVTIGGQLYYADTVSKGVFELELDSNWALTPGVYDVVVTSTNATSGIVNTQTFTLGWFNGAFVTDTITGSANSDFIMPGETTGTDRITTGNGNDIVYLTNRTRNSLNYEITDFTIGKDTINANHIINGLNVSNIADYASISYNSNGDAVVSFDSNGLANSGGNIYTVTLTGVKNATLSDVFSYKTLSTTISWDNMGSDNIVSKAEKASYSLSGTVSNPANLSGLQISSIVFTSLDGTQITVSSNLPVIDTNTGAWSLSNANMPSLADGKYTVTVNFSANGGYTKSVTNAKPVVIDTVEPTLSEAEASNTTITLTMDEYLNESSVPTTSDFSVEGNTVTALAIEGKKVTLTVGTAISDAVKVNYTGSTLEDNNGNDVDTFNTIIGTSGDNTITGTSANEIITGNAGNDTITGGAGSDTFDYNSTSDGNDTITDFTLGNGGDKLDLRDLLSYSSNQDLADYIQITHDTNTGTVTLNIDSDGSGTSTDGSAFTSDMTITLNNMGSSALTLSDFTDYNIMAV